MICVGGLLFSSGTSSSSELAENTLIALMEHPVLLSAARSFRSIREINVSAAGDSDLWISKSRFVYIFQREYATVNPELVDFVGTDEATTCVALAIRNQNNGLTSLAHVDCPEFVDIGLDQMLSQLIDPSVGAGLDVHLVGGFEDAPPERGNLVTISRGHTKLNGHSYPLCAKIVEALQKRHEKFHIRTLFVLSHNTSRDCEGNAYPVFKGLLVNTKTGSLLPASFDRTSRCPDEIVRHLRVFASYGDPIWKGKLLETYETRSDQFIIAPCRWTEELVLYFMSMQNLSDEQILENFSTSPGAEGPDFVEGMRRLREYVSRHRKCDETFPSMQGRRFVRTGEGSWKRCYAS